VVAVKLEDPPDDAFQEDLRAHAPAIDVTLTLDTMVRPCTLIVKIGTSQPLRNPVSPTCSSPTVGYNGIETIRAEEEELRFAPISRRSARLLCHRPTKWSSPDRRCPLKPDRSA